MDERELAELLAGSPLFRGGRIERPLRLHDYISAGRASFPLGMLDPHGAPCLIAIRDRQVPPLLGAYPGIRFFVSLDGAGNPVYEVRRGRWGDVSVLGRPKADAVRPEAVPPASGPHGAILVLIALCALAALGYVLLL
jgi:hypothetical protein